MTKKQRKQIFDKYDGKCAYSGTPLEPDWQADHVKPIIRNWINGKPRFENDDNLEKSIYSLVSFYNTNIFDHNVMIAVINNEYYLIRSKKSSYFSKKYIINIIMFTAHRVLS